MNEELLENEDLLDEYEGSFSSEEKISHAMKLSKESFSIDIGVVDFDDLLIPEPMKTGRKETYLGLSTSIGELGIVSPIHVMITEGYANWKNSGGSEEDFDGFRYVLLHGFRRVWGGYKNGLERCMAVIWDFKDKDKGNDISMVLSNLLHKSQKHSWMEVWEMYQLLTAQASVSESSIEYLLQIDIGDAPKLKSIMERADEFPEPKQDLLDNKKTLQQAYNMLQKQMKEVDQLAKDDVTGISDMEQAEGVVEGSEDILLSDDEIKDILEMGSGGDELSEEDFDEFMGNNLPDDGQKVGERHPLDPALKAAVLARDGYCCQVTGRGKGLPTPIALAILNVHHKVPVHAGGKDTMDNLITVCLDVHTLIHIIERNGGKVGMSKETYDALPQEEKDFITGTMKIARIAVEANRKLGRTKEQIKKDTADAVKFKMPGVVQKENMEAVKNNL
jgi:5-methylcytosine-specific restriction protein A